MRSDGGKGWTREIERRGGVLIRPAVVYCAKGGREERGRGGEGVNAAMVEVK